MKLKVAPNCGTREEYLALIQAAIFITPEDDGERDDKLFNALQDCVDSLLADVTPKEMAMILSCYDPPRPKRRER